MKTSHLALFVLLLMVLFLGPDSLRTASAQPTAWPEWTCETFPGTVDEAVDYYTTNGGPATLDADGDGIACNEASEAMPDQPGAFPEWSCLTFPAGWDAAIDYFNTQGGPASLDNDGDGVPCEDNGDDAVTECADFASVAEAQAYYDEHGQPRNLDLDENGSACLGDDDGYFGQSGEPTEDASGDPAADEPGENSADDPGTAEQVPATSLPNTGSGQGEPSLAWLPLASAALAAMMSVAAITTARRP